jgi:hypothetical protein
MVESYRAKSYYCGKKQLFDAEDFPSIAKKGSEDYFMEIYRAEDIEKERTIQEEESKNLGSVLSQEIKWKQEAQIKALAAEKKLREANIEYVVGHAGKTCLETEERLTTAESTNKKFADDLQNKIEDYGKKYCSNEISMLSECNKNFRILAQERDSLKEALKAYQEGKACSCPNCPDRKVDGE